MDLRACLRSRPLAVRQSASVLSFVPDIIISTTDDSLWPAGSLVGYLYTRAAVTCLFAENQKSMSDMVLQFVLDPEELADRDRRRRITKFAKLWLMSASFLSLSVFYSRRTS